MLSSKEHFDLIRIKEKSNGDLVFLGDIYAEFLLEIPKKMHSIKMFLKENKKDEILKICHSLIGILPLFGMESSLTIILKIKSQLQQNGIDNAIQKQFEELDFILKSVLIEMEMEISKLS